MHHYFDTHEIVKRFIGSGIKEKQAEAIIKAIAESRDYDLSNLATKTDILPLATRSELMQVKDDIKSEIAEMKGDIAEMKGDIAEMKGDIAEVRTSVIQVRADLSVQIERSKNETLRWVIGVAIASIGTMTGFMALLLKYFIVH